MKSNNSVRRPQLAHSSITTDKSQVLSIGDTLRKAKSDLFFARCVYGILIVLVIIAIACAIILGYADKVIDKFYALMQ